MTTQSLSDVALHVVGQYNEAGKHLVGAWRVGAQRAIGAADSAASRYYAFLGARKLPLLNEQAQAELSKAQEKISSFFTDRLARDTELATKAIDAVATRANDGIRYVADAAARVDSQYGNAMLNALTTLNMPAATLSKQIADRVAEGAKRIEARIAGLADSTEVATVEPKPARRAVRKAT